MDFSSTDVSVVKSIRQRDLLNTWLRCAARGGRLPALAEFEPACMMEELTELNYFEVSFENGRLRYQIKHFGERLRQIVTTKEPGTFLDEAMGPVLARSTLVIYDTCVETRRPVYTSFDFEDVIGRPLIYERLLLPFGQNDKVETIVASIKMFSPDGAFVQHNVLTTVQVEPTYTDCAIIERAVSSAPGTSDDGDVILI